MPPVRSEAPQGAKSTGAASVTPACRRILQALVLREGSASRQQVALLAGQSPTSSSFDNNLSWLNARGFIRRERSAPIAITDLGRSAAGDLGDDIPRTSADVIALFRARLEPAKQRILDALVAAWPKPVERSELADRAGASATSSSFDNNLSALSSLGVLERVRTEDGSRAMRASDDLFPTGKPH